MVDELYHGLATLIVDKLLLTLRLMYLQFIYW